MNFLSLRRRPLTGVAALFLTGIAALPAAAQGGPPSGSVPDPGFLELPRLGVGYVVNAPSMYLGFSGFAVTPVWGGIGLYVDAKFDRDSPMDEQSYIDSLTVQIVEDEIGDEFVGEEDEWKGFNAALVRPLSPQLMVYLGAGYAERERYWRYQDPGQGRGTGGFYWVRNLEESGSEINVLGGAFFRITSNIALQFGLESMPRGMTVGGAYSIPLAGR